MDADLEQLERWFHTADQCVQWGGPRFRFPFTPESFREDLRWDGVDSFSLAHDDGELLGFGQGYDKFGRRHFARIASNPRQRGKGYGMLLLRNLVDVTRANDPGAECSLYVMNNNEVAISCYRSLGFREAPMEEDIPILAECLFMILPGDGED